MAELLRRDLSEIPSYKPGKNPGQIPHSAGAGTTIKLASNEVPFGPLPGVAEAITEAASAVNRYPDLFAAALREEIASLYNIAPHGIVTGCGSVSLCESVVRACAQPGDEVVFGWRSFEAYPLITTGVGARPITVPNTADHQLDIPALADAVTPKTRVVFVCTPNNPTGTAVSRDQLTWLVETVPSDVMIVIDEAYIEFVTDKGVGSGLDLVERGNVVVTRTFSKAWGLAGARCGYLIGPPTVVETIAKVVAPFSTSALAQAGALAALQQPDEMRRRVNVIIAERARLLEELRRLRPDLGIPDSEANFVWLPLLEKSADFGAACEAGGVIVRPFAGDGVRVTVGTPEQNTRFLELAATLL